uniref:Uncharacterized protein LOC104232382 n=1 Tax=Nicotiana sylvestris TaxID=4096 RepID=A0A1U7WZ39_NICSY|nr:PREDICTED: uncharacterized protein LOC104232382 [Nicotiana sylvestris]
MRRKFNAAINEEVDKLLGNGSVRESKYPQWISNVVMVKKKNGKWRMCVDFMDLNKAYPKDSFLLPHIDQLIDSIAGNELLSFLDTYSGYNQILMEKEDQEKTTFTTHQRTYCYKVMPFGLKNAGATYQRLVNKMFKNQLGKTIEVYIDDMLVKSKRKEDHIGHLKEAFDILRLGIEVNLEQIKAIEGIPETLTSKKQEGQQAQVECRVRRFPEVTKSVLVFATLARQSRFSKTLIDAETRYPHLEKLALALVVASRKLRPYFQCHPIKVVTTFPLRSIIHKPDLSGRLAKWAIELSEHDITYQPRTAIKLQVLADFIADFSAEILLEVDQEALHTSPEQSDLWVLYTDDASNVTGSRLVLEVPMREVIRQSVRCPEMTNNEDEYEAIIARLNLALKYGARRVILRCDTQLVVNQVIGNFQIKKQRLQKYQTEIHKLLPEFDECRFNQIPRAQNIEEDGLAKLAAATRNITKENVVTLLHSSIDQVEEGTLPQDKKEAKKFRIQAARYSFISQDLYKRTFGSPLAKCLGPNQTRRLLEEVHEGHYGAYNVIFVEVGEPSLRYSNESGSSNDESRLQDLDEVEERRDMAHIRMVAQKQRAERYYNKKAKVRPLRVGDYVLKAKTQATKDPNEGKLGTNWDGPYKITTAASKGAFQLETMKQKLLQNNWNVAHLKYFHF